MLSCIDMVSESLRSASYTGRAERESRRGRRQMPRLRPYVPCLVWKRSTWEDWSQLEPGDWLHWPFSQEEEDLIMERVQRYAKKARKRKLSGLPRLTEGIWEMVADGMMGRRPTDVRRFWIDRMYNFDIMQDTPAVVTLGKGKQAWVASFSSR